MCSSMLISALLPGKCAQTLLAVALRPSQAGRGSLHLKLASAAFLLSVKLEGLLLMLLLISWPASSLWRECFL